MFRNTSLTSGSRAVEQYNAMRATSRTGNGGNVAQRGRAHDAQAFDAASSSGLTFLQAQLELIDPNLVKPLQATTHARDIPIEFGGGFPEFISAWASNYGSTGSQFYGLQGTNNTDIPEAQVDIQKGIWPTYNWAQGFTLTYFDLQRMLTAQRSGQPAPFSLQDLYEKSVLTTWGKALDYVTYNGFLGGSGLCNNPNSPAVVVPNGGSGTTWLTKTPAQILADVNFGINQTVMNSGYDFVEGAANTMLIPLQPQFSTLTQPMTVGGVPVSMSTIEYIEKNCVAAAYGIPFKILPLPNPWISGVGLGGSDRGVMYKRDKESLYLKVPTPATKAMTVPTTKDGGAYETLYVGNTSAVIFRRTTTMIYLDGV